MRGKSIVTVAAVLLGIFATIPSAAAASTFDNYYVNVDSLNLVNTSCQNPNDDVSNSWSQYVLASSWGSSFARAQSSGTGSWGVSLLPHYHSSTDSSGNTVTSANAVIVYWSETAKMTIQWTSTGYMIAQTPDHTIIIELGGSGNNCSTSVSDYGSQGNIGTGYISSTHGDVANYFFNGDASYPAGYAGPRIDGIPAALNIAATVSDYEPWVDPTDQPFVRLTASVTNASGNPAVGAKVHFSNAPLSSFVVPPNGIVSVVEDVSKGVPDITLSATLGSTTASKDVHVFDATPMAMCTLPYHSDGAHALAQLLDDALVTTPPGRLFRIADTLLHILSGIHTVTPEAKDSLAMVSTVNRYTGSFSTIYSVSTSVVTNDASQVVVKTLPGVFSRNYNLVGPLFNADGTPKQTYAYGGGYGCGPLA